MIGIEGMEMPKNCVECKLFHFHFDLDGGVHCLCKYGNIEVLDFETKRADICPLIESLEETENKKQRGGRE